MCINRRTKEAKQISSIIEFIQSVKCTLHEDIQNRTPTLKPKLSDPDCQRSGFLHCKSSIVSLTGEQNLGNHRKKILKAKTSSTTMKLYALNKKSQPGRAFWIIYSFQTLFKGSRRNKLEWSMWAVHGWWEYNLHFLIRVTGGSLAKVLWNLIS